MLDCGVPLVQLPCMGVVDKFSTTVSELEHYIDGKTPIGTYLTSLLRGCDSGKANSRVIWDVTAVSYLVHPEWFNTELIHTPILTEEPEVSQNLRRLDCYKKQHKRLYWSHDSGRHFMKAVRDFNRDRIFYDLFTVINSMQ